MSNPSPIPVPTPIVELKADTNSSLSSKRSLLCQFFTYKSPRYYCNYCPKSFSDKSTFTLWRHVNKHHPKIVAETQKQEEKIGEMDKFVISDQKENILAIGCDNASNMDVMLENISQFLKLQNIIFNPNNHRIRCLAHVINLGAKKLIDHLYMTNTISYEDENAFEVSEDNDDNLKDAIYKLRKVIVKIRASIPTVPRKT
ncbi:hypothetical protein C1646_677836 [Rhizophagus diaphanus]|nr:hypothetical protein C1646_677836 [Rhizophagus diaphanus] [Rhizophagus sp. MUCL 43196]